MKRTVISATVLALAMSGVGVSQAARPENTGKPAESGFKVTGGGQIIADASGGGAGDTVGFVAQEMDGDNESTDAPDDAARGQFQFVPRSPDESGNQPANEKFHGVVTCLISGGEADRNEEQERDTEDDEQLMRGTNSARFGGYLRDDPQTFFTVDVTDGGQGAESSGDFILVRFTTAPCADNPEDENNEPEELFKLGRGNVKIHNYPTETDQPPADSEPASASAVTSLVG